ncbi:14888_t:CDS:1 [Cetraspora pellucida]|uniref:14888_t:CDS:1 n=1 Tax=Cetraspora pellucida TaxID=1433469 RepID=A0ACA9KL23_9GLOM|nr:14888_t:CDS:1 [Cetraspora pellucida]
MSSTSSTSSKSFTPSSPKFTKFSTPSSPKSSKFSMPSSPKSSKFSTPSSPKSPKFSTPSSPKSPKFSMPSSPKSSTSSSPAFPTSFISQVWFIAKLTFGNITEVNQQESDVSFAYSLANSHLPKPKTTNINSKNFMTRNGSTRNVPIITERRPGSPMVLRRRSIIRDTFLKPIRTVVRKKSGEIVKPSLKDKNNQSTDTFHNKVVHFNSNLEQVLSFKKNSVPKAIGFRISKQSIEGNNKSQTQQASL